jgi:pilus assembly protein CpaB
MVNYNAPKGFNNINKGNKSGNNYNKNLKISIIALVLIFCVIATFVLQAVVGNSNQNGGINGVDNGSMSQIGSVPLFQVGRAINSGEPIPVSEVKQIYWPLNQVPQGAVRALAELKDMYAKVPISANVPLLVQQLMDKPVTTSLPVTPGNRAVTIEIDATSGLEGNALPGTYVDVVLTYHINGVLTSKVIVQNTRVLSLQGSTKSIDEIDLNQQKGAPVALQTITLDVSPRDALAITTSRQLGRLSLMMRHPGDEVVLAEDEINQNEIGPSLQLAQPQRSQPVVAKKCIKGTYKINGKDYLLDCDNNTTLLNQGEDDF